MSGGDLKFLGGVSRRLKSDKPKQLRRSASNLQFSVDEYLRLWPALSESFARDVARLLERADQLEKEKP